MITWASPWAFALLVPVWLSVFLPLLVGRNRMAVASVSALSRRWSLRVMLAWVPELLRPLGLSLLVLALARPQIVRKEVMVDSEGLDIMLTVDTSGSMSQEDFTAGGRPVDRLSITKAVLAEFVKGRPHDRIGLVVFGEEAFTQVPLTLDHGSLTGVLGQLEIGVAGSRGTAIGTGLAVSTKRLKELEAPSKVVVLLTDGRNNAGRISPQEAAEAAHALGIRLYVVGVGGAERGMFGIARDGLDEPGLKRMAAAAGGQYFRATDTRGLKEIYDKIDELEPSPAEVEEITDALELYRRYLIPGMVLLALQQLLSMTWLRRGP